MKEWSSDAMEKLKALYIETNIPSDTLIKNKDALSEFTMELNSRITEQGNFSSEEVASEIFKIRKSGKLPKIRS